jgi:TatD DNase family protein
MVDAHCHIDLYPNPKEILDECESSGIFTIAVTNLPSHFAMGFIHTRNYKKIRLALGLHPLHASRHVEELPRFQEYLDRTSYIGEVGLDFSKEGIETKEIQLASFRTILGYLKDKNKIVSIHSRRAEKEVLNLLQEFNIKTAIFHWYSGPEKMIQNIVDAGYYFSVNIAMTTSAAGRRIIAAIPSPYLLTESDGPYTMTDGKPSRPIDMAKTLQAIAEVRMCDSYSLSKQVQQNFFTVINALK